MTVRELDIPVREAKRRLLSHRIYRLVGHHVAFIDERGTIAYNPRKSFAKLMFDPTMTTFEKSRVYRAICESDDPQWPKVRIIDDPKQPYGLHKNSFNICEW